jgi:hypothetical protein
MPCPLPLKYLIGILFADFISPVLAEGVNDHQLPGPGKVLQASPNRPPIIGGEDIYGNGDLLDHFFPCLN